MTAYYVSTLIALLLALDAGWSELDCHTKGCSHECKHSGRRWYPRCLCPADMVLGIDGKTCEDVTSFILAMSRGIILYNGGTRHHITVASSKASCIDYHYGRKELYAYINNAIMRFTLPRGVMPEKTVARTKTTVTSLAVDWVQDVIYYILDHQSAIGAVSLEGEDQRTILTHNGSSTAGWQNLVVDPHAKKLFWVGGKRVYSCGLDGKDLKINLIDWVKTDKIALDTSNKVIFAIGQRGNSRNKYITRASYNGTRAEEDIEIIQPAAASVFGFGVVGNTAYWESSHEDGNLYKCGLGKARYGKTAASPVAGQAKGDLLWFNEMVYDMKVYYRNVQTRSK